MGNLEDLAKHRDALMLAEVAAWLHMFGKLSEEFLGGKTQYAREIPPLVKDTFPDLFKLLKEDKWVGNIWNTLPLIGRGAENLTISQLIESHEKDPENYHEIFRKLLIDAHGRGSGSEKGTFIQFTLRRSEPFSSSTVFGSEAEVKLQDIQTLQKGLYIFLGNELAYLKDHNGLLNNWELWEKFRSEFIRKLWKCFGSAIADDRRPINDVTLFDQTALSVAFFKAALAQPLLSLKGLDVKGKDTNQQVVTFRYKARLLRVALDGFAFWKNAVRISDLKARSETIKRALDAIRSLIEVKYPLGFEIYRDENGSIFIVPDVEDLLSYQDNHSSLLKLIEERGEDALSQEAIPTVLPLSPPMRMMLSLKHLINVPLSPQVPSSKWVVEQWKEKALDICQVCGLRPQASQGKSFDRKICDDCNRRRQKRSSVWAINLHETIWIDEVADNNGLIALIIGQFSLLSWLDSEFLSTIPLVDIKDSILTESVKGKPPVYHDFSLNKIDDEFSQGLAVSGQFKDFAMINDLRSKGIDEAKSIGEFYSEQVLDTDLRPVSLEDKPYLLTLSLIRRSPNPARIYRAWRTAKAFWQSSVSDFKTTIGEIGPRLYIQGKFIAQGGGRDTLGITHTYELKLANVNLSISCVAEEKFLTVDNLRRTANLVKQTNEYSGDEDKVKLSLQAAEYLQERLSGKSFPVEEPTGYGSSNKTLGTLQITEVTLENTPYVPAISILSEPRTFVALVPADKALCVAKAIKEKYETEMGKVRNRLPLTLGIVFAGRHTPLPAILDAGRRMLKQPTEDERWKIKHTSWKVKVADDQYTQITDPGYPRPPWPVEITLMLVKEDQSLEEQQPQEIKIPTVMGDQTTPDVWYTYWCLEKQTPNPEKRERLFKGINGKDWTHVCDLQPGDVVSFMPSPLDFELLDTASRRYEVSYENGKRQGSVHPARPYYLEQLKDFEELWETLSKGLATSQIDNLVGIIETKRMKWGADQKNQAFKQMVRDALNNANWRKGTRPGSIELEKLCRAAMSGQLTDTVELYMTILKRKTQIDQMEETNEYSQS